MRCALENACCRTRRYLQLQLFRAGDVESNPGPIKPFSVFCANINSIRSATKRTALAAVLESLQWPVVVALQETKLSSAIEDPELQLRRYQILRKDRSVGGGGVLIAVDRSFACKRRKEFEHPDCESVFCEISGAGRGTDLPKVLVGSYYRPNAQDRVSVRAFCSSLRDASLYCARRGFCLVVSGDFNMGDIGWLSDGPLSASNEGSRQFCDTISDCSLSQMVSFPTRGTRILDLVVTSHPGLVQQVTCVPVLSDHCGISVLLRRPLARTDDCLPVVKPLWSAVDWPRVVASLEDELVSVTSSQDVDQSWNCLSAAILKTIATQVPSKTIRKREAFPREIVKLLRRKERAYKAWRRYQSEANRERYRELQARAQRECRRFHSSKVTRVAEIMKEDPRPFWRFVRQLRVDSSSIPPLVSGSKIFSSPSEKANLLRSTFGQVCQPRAGLGDSKSPFCPANIAHTAMERVVVDDLGVLHLLMKIKTSKASGPDKIPGIFLREACFGLYKAVASLFKLCLQQRRVPTAWKQANVHPIFKKGDKSDPGNYRPIALLSILSKQFEHVIARAISQHLNLNSLIDPRQHGFRRGRSTETALTSVRHRWAGFLDQTYSSVDALFLDFSKAFDTVNHHLLLLKLRANGISEDVVDLIRNYLTGRTQRVVVDGAFSDPYPVSCGVPQGSILGPLLFTVFINDLFKAVTRGSGINAYADDTLLYRSITHASDIASLQADLQAVEKWATLWNLQFNVSKCACMRISLNQRARSMYPPASYTLNGATLANVAQTRYLGVVLQDNFRLTRHYFEVVNACNRLIGLLKRNISAASRAAKRTAYIALVRSRLDYACAVYDPHEITHIEHIEAVQNRGARFIMRDYSRYSSVTDMKVELKLEPLICRRKEARHRLVRNYLNDQSSIPGAKIVRKRSSFYFLPVVGLKLLLQTPLYRTTSELFNAIDNDDGRQQRPP